MKHADDLLSRASRFSIWTEVYEDRRVIMRRGEGVFEVEMVYDDLASSLYEALSRLAGCCCAALGALSTARRKL